MATKPEDKSKGKAAEPEQVLHQLEALPGQDEFYRSINTEAVLERIRVRVTGSWVYHLKFGKKHVYNLGADGSVEAGIALTQLSRGQYCIKSKDIKRIHHTDTHVAASVEVGLFTKLLHPITGEVIDVELLSVIGHFSQWKTIIRKDDGKRVPVQHPETQAVVKAERNGRNKLIAKQLRDAIIKEAIQKKKVEEEDGQEGSQGETREPREQKSQPAPKKEGGFPAAKKDTLAIFDDLLKSEFLGELMKTSGEKARERGMTEPQAQAWIVSLQESVKAAKKKADAQKKREGELA